MSRAETRSRARAPGRKPEADPGAASFLQGKKMIAVLSALLGALTIALYSPVLGHMFVVFDDRGYVTANTHVQEGLAWNTIKWAFTTTQEGHWHPLTWLSHAFDYQLFALNPAGHHLDSVLIHAINAVLLFLLLAWATKRVGASLLVAGLFAVHPLNVESVAWVAERKNVLSTFFFLLTIGAYVRYAQKPDWRRYMLVAALFAAALMSKPSVITLPFVLLLLDYWPLNRAPGSPASAIGAPQFPIARLLAEKIPLLLLSAGSAFSTVAAQRSGVAVYGLHHFPLTIRIENAVVSYGLYLWKTVWPARLIALYPYSATALPLGQVILSALVLVGVTALTVIFSRRRYLLVGWLWFLGTLIPVIGLVTIAGDASMADRYVYIPLIGIFVMIAWSADDWAEAGKVNAAGRVIPALCLLLALGAVTYHQMSYWSSEYGLWAHALTVDDRNLYAHDWIADALMNPDSSLTQQDLGNFDTPQKRMDAARLNYEEALKLRRELAKQSPATYLPYMAPTLNNLGSIDLNQNRTEEAHQDFAEALQIQRELPRLHIQPYPLYLATTLANLAGVDLRQNRTDDARQHYEEAVQSFRQMAEQSADKNKYQYYLATTLSYLGNVDRMQNRTDEARQNYEEALRSYHQLTQDPATYLLDMVTTFNNLGNLDREQNRMNEARAAYQGALNVYRQMAQIDAVKYLPLVAMALQNLGDLDRKQSRIDESRTYYQEALGIFRQLQQGDSRYAGDVAATEASLRELDKK